MERPLGDYLTLDFRNASPDLADLTSGGSPPSLPLSDYDNFSKMIHKRRPLFSSLPDPKSKNKTSHPSIKVSRCRKNIRSGGVRSFRRDGVHGNFR
ncbi:hypothetical protein E2C01_101709 [Portunus trituberculatus]|uniref:Uncharacterized protein n=1 Tax=Portunus trituberculatus TaxID=210409 RepID=A0A5B7KGR2_PORTR|nr:hypothetical protein [Portunus trituberculatus]